MPRFVILTHNFPELHWDLMLEKEAALRTWKLFRPPDEPGPTDSQALPDHRLMYLDYEGPVSNNRGEVRRWDTGEYLLLCDDEHAVRFEISGGVLRGIVTLECSEVAKGWTYRFVPTAVAE